METGFYRLYYKFWDINVLYWPSNLNRLHFSCLKVTCHIAEMISDVKKYSLKVFWLFENSIETFSIYNSFCWLSQIDPHGWLGKVQLRIEPVIELFTSQFSIIFGTSTWNHVYEWTGKPNINLNSSVLLKSNWRFRERETRTNGEKVYYYFCKTERFRKSPVVHAIDVYNFKLDK